MADRFWVNGTGNYSDDVNHWATVDGGAPGAGNKPTAADNARFTALSNPTAYTVTIDAASVCLDLKFEAAPSVSGTITWAGSQTLTISGSLLLLAGMTRTYTGNITFNSTAAGKTMTFNNVVTASVMTFNGVGGEWILQDNLSNGASNIAVNNGTFDANNKNITAAGSLNASIAGTRTIKLGSGTHTFSGVTPVSFTNAANFTLNAGTSTIVLSNAGPTLAGNGSTFNNVTFNAGTGTASITGANAFNTLTIGGASGRVRLVSLSANQIATTLTTSGVSAPERVAMRSNTTGTARTMTAAAVSLTDVDFMDIAGAGAASPFTGTRLGNLGGNSGITFTTPKTVYWVGNSAAWSTNVWASVSGGAAAVNNYPLAQDTAIFDNNSFSANGQTVTFTIVTTVALPNIDLSAITKTGITLSFPNNNTNFYGDLKLEANMVVSGAGSINFRGRGVQLITTAGVAWGGSGDIATDQVLGTFQPQDSFVRNAGINTFTQSSGTIDLNGVTLEFPRVVSSSGPTRTIKSSLAGGKLRSSDTSATIVFSFAGTGLTVDRTGNNWSIEVGGNTANTRTFASGGGVAPTFPGLTFTNTTANGRLNFTGSGTFRSLSYTGGTAQTFGFTAGTTTTIETNGGFFGPGTLGNVITIASITAANHNLALVGGGISTVISKDFMSVSRSQATPAGAWGAGHNSADGGNNSGWNFGDAFLADESEAVAATDESSTGASAACPEQADAIDSQSGISSIPAATDEISDASDSQFAILMTMAETAEATVAIDSSDRTVDFSVDVLEQLAALDHSVAWRSNVKVNTTFVGADPTPPPPPTPDPYPVRVHESHIP